MSGRLLVFFRSGPVASFPRCRGSLCGDVVPARRLTLVWWPSRSSFLAGVLAAVAAGASPLNAVRALKLKRPAKAAADFSPLLGSVFCPDVQNILPVMLRVASLRCVDGVLRRPSPRRLVGITRLVFSKKISLLPAPIPASEKLA